MFPAFFFDIQLKATSTASMSNQPMRRPGVYTSRVGLFRSFECHI